MNLSRAELIRAKDRQLSAVGIKRKESAGWLKLALVRDFTEEEIEHFKEALNEENKSTPKAKIVSDRTQTLIDARDAAKHLASLLTRLIEQEKD
jgi:hypothetical protein